MPDVGMRCTGGLSGAGGGDEDGARTGRMPEARP